MKHPGHQRVFVIPQPGSLYKVAVWKSKGNKTRSMRTQILRDLWWLTSRLMHHVQNKLLRLVLHLNKHKHRQFVHVSVFWQTVPKLASCIAAAYPELVKQQVEDLFCRHGAVDSHVGHWTVGRGEYRRLHKKMRNDCSELFDYTEWCHFNRARWGTRIKKNISRSWEQKTMKIICISFAASRVSVCLFNIIRISKWCTSLFF